MTTAGQNRSSDSYDAREGEARDQWDNEETGVEEEEDIDKT